MDLSPVSAIDIPGYKIIKTLGVGGQATVYLAIQQGFDREVALKVMSPALAADPTFGDRFIREAKIVAKLAHSRIVTVYDVGESGSFYYLAMEYMRGEELKTRIAKGLKAKEALLIIAKLAQALHFAHQKGYIHRDVKSENILFDEDDQPVLTDFGIAKASNSSTQMTQTGKLIGTPEYMSPEQCRGRKLDGRSDLYSLGIILYEMLGRKVPFTGEDSVSVCIQHVTKPVPKLPARLNHMQWLIDSLLAKNPANRFQSGKELAQAIKDYLSDGVKTEKIVSHTSKTKISKVIDKSPQDENYDDHSFELNDEFEVDQRINVLPESKSRVPFIAVSFLLIILLGLGFKMRADWLPSAQEFVGVDWFDSNGNLHSPDTKNDHVVAQEKEVKNSTVDKSNGDKNNAIEGSEEVNQLIQQADTLAQYMPHELSDIKRALEHLVTAKSLAPSNQDIVGIKNKIVSIALSEAISSASKQQFSNAQQWIDLVDATDRDNIQLVTTKKNIASIKQNFEKSISDQTSKINRLAEYFSNAEQAVSENRLNSPKNNNAVYYLQQAATIDQENVRIEQIYKTIENKYHQLIEKQIKGNKYSSARSFVRRLKELPFANQQLNSLEKRITALQTKFQDQQNEKRKLAAIAEEKAKVEDQRQQKLADPLIQMRLQSLLSSANDFFEQEQLVEPIGLNALEKFKAVLDIDPKESIALAGVKKIESTITTNLEVALSNQISQSAEIWLAKLSRFDESYPKMEDYQRQLDEIRIAESIAEKNVTVENNETGNGTEITNLISDSSPEPAAEPEAGQNEKQVLEITKKENNVKDESKKDDETEQDNDPIEE